MQKFPVTASEHGVEHKYVDLFEIIIFTFIIIFLMVEFEARNFGSEP